MRRCICWAATHMGGTCFHGFVRRASVVACGLDRSGPDAVDWIMHRGSAGFGRLEDEVLMRVAELFLALPWIYLLLRCARFCRWQCLR